jgi:cell division control protein 6
LVFKFTEPVGAVLDTLSDDKRLQEIPVEELGKVVKRRL